MEQNEKQVELSELEPIESSGGVDLNKYHKTNAKIETAEIVQVASKFTECKTQWVLKVSSTVLETLEREDEDNIDFRASELFNLSQDDEGKLLGYPDSEDSNIGKFMADLKVKEPKEIVGKEITIKAYDKEVGDDKKTYLKFLY